MKLRPFELEKYFGKYEFSVEHLLSCSDCQPMLLADLIDHADGSTLSMWENLELSYTIPQGHPVVLDTVASLYDGIVAANVLEIIPEEGIYITMRTLIQAGDHVVCVSPCYQSLEEIAISQGATVDRWSAIYDSGWRFSIDELRTLVTSKTRMIVINFPHNPTGAMLSRAEFEQVVDIARTNDCILFSDEMYRYLEYRESDRLPSACEVYENAISLCGMSKTFAMPGARSGWLATQRTDYIQALMTYKDYTTICTSATSQVLTIMGLRQRDRIVARNLQIISANLDIFADFAKKHNNIISYTPPIAGSLSMPIVDSSIDIDKLADDIVTQKSLMILPASVYGIDSNAFRLGLGRSDFALCIDILDKHLLTL